MDLAVVPTQLGAGQGAACYRFASDKDPRHALMMRAATDSSPRLPPRSWSAAESQPPRQSRRRDAYEFAEIAAMVVVGGRITAPTAISAQSKKVIASWAARSPCSTSA